MTLTPLLAASWLLPVSPVVEIDFANLPAANTFQPYTMRLKIEFASGAKDEVPFAIHSDAEPRDVQTLFRIGFGGPKWTSESRGASYFIYAYDGSPVTKFELTSTGPKPTVRWVLRASPKKNGGDGMPKCVGPAITSPSRVA